MKKRVAILGSTGSIGVQALEVIKANPDSFEVEAITGNNNADLLIKQAREFLPNFVVIVDDNSYSFVSKSLSDLPIKVFAGRESLSDIVEMSSVDIVLTAIVGFAGLEPTIKAIKASKLIALANKETLVVAGEYISNLTKKHNTAIIPVDSEHSAIFQSLQGDFQNNIEKIYLTASGGPFRGKKRDFLKHVTKDHALKHPNWVMGNKITIDSATLMNKGLEVIEAKWLFDLSPDQIDVIIHPQSIIHSIVQFEDSSMKAQLGLPDMRVPIQYALSYPNRLKSKFERFDFKNFPIFGFEAPDLDTFRNLGLAYEAMHKGGNLPCIMNAANEIVVEAFLQDNIGFLQMSEIIESAMSKATFINKPTIEELIQSDGESRIITRELVKKQGS